MTTRLFLELERGERRRAITRAVLTVVLSWAVLLTAYFEEPLDDHVDVGAFTLLAVGVLLVACVLAFQLRKIVRAKHPTLQAVQALGIFVPIFLVVFASVYLSMSTVAPGSFNTHLDHTKAIYFTITVLSTVGFGDIVPSTDNAMIVVSIQMLLDLVLIGVVVRAMLSAAKLGVARRQAGPDSPSDPAGS